jgi:hypothetical protein
MRNISLEQQLTTQLRETFERFSTLQSMVAQQMNAVFQGHSNTNPPLELLEEAALALEAWRQAEKDAESYKASL